MDRYSDLYKHQQRLKLYLPLSLLWGAYLAVEAVRSGVYHWSRGNDISRATSPFEFWILVLGIAAITIFATRMTIRYREAIWGDWESSRRKVFEYLGLFCFLSVVYAIYVSVHVSARTHVPGAPPEDALVGYFVKLCLLSALPFAVLAYTDKAWDSNDAAPVCVVAWVVVCYYFSCNCTVCAFGLVFPFLPFVLSALVAHGIGLFCRQLKDGGMKSIYGS